MKYAIASVGVSLEDKLDSRFGRCRFIVIADTHIKSVEFIPNPYRDVDTDAGLKLIAFLNDRGVKKIVSGSFGEKIKDSLDSKKIQMIIPEDTGCSVGEIIDMIHSA
jgi:predicted Fe-Mo cluster-binding NifX family protein